MDARSEEEGPASRGGDVVIFAVDRDTLSVAVIAANVVARHRRAELP